MNRLEVWETIVSSLEQAFTRGEFEANEFEVAFNSAIGSVTIIDRTTNECFEMTDTTYAHYDEEMRIVFPTHSRLTGVKIDYSYRR